MVLFFSSNVLPGADPVTIYVGKDKVENEELIKYALPEDVWVHVDKLSSAHIYIRLPKGMMWESIPETLLADAGQLVKANSIQDASSCFRFAARERARCTERLELSGNKQNNVTIIYTPASNLKKTGDMAVGAVSFHNDKKVKRFYVAERQNAIVNRLNKTKKEVEVDHEAERIARQSEEARKKRLEANTRRNEELELARKRKQESESRSYATMHEKKGTYEEEDEEWESKQKLDDFDPDDDFM